MDQAMPNSLREVIAQLDAQGISDRRRYGAVRRFLNFKARSKGIPISGSFELTPLCNLDCKMCYVHLHKPQMRDVPLLTAEQWKRIMQQAVDAGMLYARLTGGECLTYPGFRELYLFLRSRGVETVILTNGLLLEQEMTDFLIQNPPAAMQISLYGASEDAYERVTGKRVFSSVMENVRRIKASGLPLTMAVTPSEYMTDGEEIVRLLADEGLPFSINAGMLQPRPETGRALADTDLDSYITMLKLRARLKGQEPMYEVDPERLPDIGGKQGNAGFGVTCGAGRSAFAVDWHGNMRPCNNFPCQGENVISLGFDEAWKRTHHTATHFPLPAECEGCAYKGLCKHCVAEHAAGAQPGHASPVVCEFGRQMIREGLLTMNHQI